MSASNTADVARNRLLASLAPDELDRLRPLLVPVTLVSGQVLHERGNPIDQVFFMARGLASLTADTLDDGQVEVGMIGPEGLVGFTLLLSPQAPAINRAFIQMPGDAWRMTAAHFRQAVEQSPALRAACLRYIHTMMVQTAQTAACNARHEVVQRLARWLLMSHDRAECDDLPLTQEFLALMLGVRRAGVSLAAQTLQVAGLIGQSRGRITVLDRDGLEATSCACYGVLRKTTEQIIGGGG